MDGILVGMTTPESIMSVIGLYEEYMPTAQDRQIAFELVTLLDHVATTEQSKIESEQRSQAEAKAKAKAGPAPMGGGGRRRK